MPIDPSYREQNAASRGRIRRLAALSDEALQARVGQHWTAAIVLAHLAWWDRRVLYVLEQTEQRGELFIPEIDININDISLPLWAAIPPRAAAEICIAMAEEVDRRLEAFDPALLEAIFAYNRRWVIRALHRNEHLAEAEAALAAAGVSV